MSNLQWIAEMEPLIEKAGDSAVTRLSEVYGLKWPLSQPLRVDVTAFGVETDSRLPRPHLVVGSLRPEYTGLEGFERLVYSAAFLLNTPGWGSSLNRDLYQEMRSHSKPYRMFHMELYSYTVGVVVKDELDQVGLSHESAEFAQNDNEWWNRMLGPFELYWRPFLEGQVGKEDALRLLIAHALAENGQLVFQAREE